MIIGWCLHCPFNNVGDEHRGGFLDVVAAGVEERIEGELWTTGEVEAFGTPGDFFLWKVERGKWKEITFKCRICGRTFLFPLSTFLFPQKFRIDSDAYRGLFVEGSYEAVKAGVAHHQPRLPDEILR